MMPNTAGASGDALSVRVAGVVLAAGGSTRMGAPKALIRDENGVTLVTRAVRTLAQGGCAPVLVVVGAEQDAIARALRAETEAGAAAMPWQLVSNPHWQGGMGTSIAAGVAALAAFVASVPAAAHAPSGAAPTPGAAREAAGREAAGPASTGAVEAVVIAAVDMPGIDAQHVAALIAASAGGTRRVASTWVDAQGESVMGVPALLPQGDWPHLMQLTGEAGARGLLRDGGVISVFIREHHYDLDTPDALASWQRRSGIPADG